MCIRDREEGGIRGARALLGRSWLRPPFTNKLGIWHLLESNLTTGYITYGDIRRGNQERVHYREAPAQYSPFTVRTDQCLHARYG